MRHLDLFSGIGGFALAADTVFGNVDHVFCDNEPFAQAVLHKHWPESYIFNDIRAIKNTGQLAKAFADTYRARLEREDGTGQAGQPWPSKHVDIITGGFPCQPFSAAGARRGTADDRHLWPEMLRIIQLAKPEWVIAENVRGITNWNGGVVFEQVCADLEAAGYDVQPFIIPAVAVNAPHRRDRVWFVAHTASVTGGRGAAGKNNSTPGKVQKRHQMGKSTEPNQAWNRPWTEVAAELCGVDNGLPARLDGLELTKSAHRKAQLKAYGNAIVPQVAMQIMEAIA